MSITAESLKGMSRELDSSLEAFEKAYLHFLYDYEPGTSMTEVYERDLGAVAFYKIKDMISDFASGLATGQNQVKAAEPPKKKERNELREVSTAIQKEQAKGKTAVKTPPVQTEQTQERRRGLQNVPSPTRTFGTYTVVSTLGAIRIVNTEDGPMYSAKDIAEISGVRADQTWMKRNCKSGNPYGIVTYKIDARYEGASGMYVSHKIQFVDRENAEKIMSLSLCPEDVAEWVRMRAFAFSFPKDAKKNKIIVENADSGKTSDPQPQNSVKYSNGKLELNWAY